MLLQNANIAGYDLAKDFSASSYRKSQTLAVICLSIKKGIKVNFLRIINCMCELGFFADKNGNNISKKEVFHVVGKSINQDLSSFHIDLSTTKATANSDMKNTFSIFERMKDKQQEINNK